MITKQLEKIMYGTAIVPIIVETEQDYFQIVRQKISQQNLDFVTKSLEAQFPVPAMPILPLPPLPRLPFLPPPPAPPQPPIIIPPSPPFVKSQNIPLFNMLSLVAPAQDIEIIDSIQGVKKVYYNDTIYALQGPSPERIWLETSNIHPALEIGRAKTEGMTGKGVVVAVLDTGAQRLHPMLLGKVECHTSMFGQVEDENGHGSWCLNCIGGSKYTDALGVVSEGIAPDVTLVSIKCLGFGIGTGTNADVLKAMEMAVQRGTHIVSMSLGSAGVKEEERPLCGIINATKDRIIWVIAAGNSGPGPETIGTPGNAKNAVTVGSQSKTDNAPAHFSSRGPTLDGYIKPDCISYGGGRKDKSLKPDEYVYQGTAFGSVLDGAIDKTKMGSEPLHGTSMATPTLAAIISLWKQKHPGLTTSDVFRILKTAGVTSNNDRGHGLVTYGWIDAF